MSPVQFKISDRFFQVQMAMEMHTNKEEGTYIGTWSVKASLTAKREWFELATPTMLNFDIQKGVNKSRKIMALPAQVNGEL